jgi:O-antigen/teichoic acid export membrane protein
MHQRLNSWRQDHLLRGVVKSSSYLFSSNALSVVLSFLQGIFAVRLLGADGYGLVSGTVIVFASNIHRLFSFRMSEVVVKYFGQALSVQSTGSVQRTIQTTDTATNTEAVKPTVTADKRERAAAVVKSAGLVEAGTSVLAYLVLLLLAPWAAEQVAKDPQTAYLFRFYGLVLFSNLVYETSTGVLQATRRFDRLALINIGQSILTAALICAAFLYHGSAFDVLAAYLLGKTLAGLGVAALALRQLNTCLGKGWQRTSLRHLTDWREIAHFAIQTNLNGTVNLFVRDNIPLYLGALRPDAVAQTEVGYFKLALTIINLVMLPIEPFIWPTYAEITRTIAQKQWQATRRLLKRVSTIAGLWTLAAGGGITLLGWWLIPLVYGSGMRPTYPAVLILLIGYGFANILNWNRPLLLALGKPSFPVMVAIAVGLVEILLALWLVPTYGYRSMAAILSAYLVVSISIIVWRGRREIS